MVQTAAHQVFPEDLRAFAEAKLGSLWAVRPCGWSHAESQVWALTGEQPAFLKMLRQRRKFLQELYAYCGWLPKLENVPRLIAEDEGRQMLLISAVLG